jgi:hypothetical protein
MSTATTYSVAGLDRPVNQEALASGVSWPAVFAGAFVTAALSLTMLALGAGLGLSAISPWSHVGASAATVGSAAIAWVIFNGIVSSAMGGYLAGRLRTKWAAIHTDEVYFRDTAHGFLVWAVAVVMTAAFLATAAASMTGSSASMLPEAGTDGYFVDSLFRSNQPATQPGDPALYDEASLMFTRAVQHGQMAEADQNYLAQLVATRTALDGANAQKRVADVFNRAKAELDASRKAAAHVLLWLFLALLIGAFCSSYAATIGGRQRDHIKTI